MENETLEKIGKYRIIKQLGAGGFGAVYLAEDPILKEQVAIKIFQVNDANLLNQTSSVTEDAETVLKKRFIDEARVLRKLSSNPNIVELYEFDQTEQGQPYYIMPYLRHSLAQDIGKDVQDVHVIAELPVEQRPRPLPFEKASLILKQLLQALKTVHEADLVHRDIKPANILFNEKGDVQLCDFGIAKLPDTEHSQTSSGIAMGSRNYMAPEQRESAKHVDATADIYSFGVLAYRIYIGTLPVGRFADPSKLMPSINQDLNDLILDCLSQLREDRPANASVLMERFNHALKNQSTNSPIDESTGTWIEAGKSGLRDELLPLRDKIADLLKAHGEVPETERAKLTILAEMADLNTEQLDALIEETYQGIEQHVKPKRKFLEVLDNKLAVNGALDNEEHEALTSAASH